MQEQLDRIEDKVDNVTDLLTEHRVEEAGRLGKLEIGQASMWWVLSAGLSVLGLVLGYLITK